MNTASPAVNSRRRPNRSPSVAPVSSSTANVSVYAFTVHCRPSSPACKCSRIDGSAVVTTRLSSEAALHQIVQAHRKLRADGCRLELVGPSRAVARILQLSAIDQVIPVRASA